MGTNLPRDNIERLEGQLFSDFKLIRRLGSGSFGVIYEARIPRHNNTGNINTRSATTCAIKIENADTINPQLFHESKLYELLQGEKGIPRLIRTAMRWGRYNFLAMEHLGPSLEDLFCYCSRMFTHRTVVSLAVQLIDRMNYIHTKQILHRDIKPNNFLMGLNYDTSDVYIVDFGLAKRYIDQRRNVHIPFRNGKKLTGTARYVSVNAHKGLEQSRRDDLISIGYVLIYFGYGSLPWQGLKAETRKQKYELIAEKKSETSLATLCRGFPEEYHEYLEYSYNLNFSQTPSYEVLRNIFNEPLNQYKNQGEFEYDWTFIKRIKMYLYYPCLIKLKLRRACFSIIREIQMSNNAICPNDTIQCQHGGVCWMKLNTNEKYCICQLHYFGKKCHIYRVDLSLMKSESKQVDNSNAKIIIVVYVLFALSIMLTITFLILYLNKKRSYNKLKKVRLETSQLFQVSGNTPDPGDKNNTPMSNTYKI
ncbi:hypothetical protein A3Q56_01204 [Intoshia linei]|uniref:non-specific serine/threonine protein kinase n=1 Tax=Intoshia linei TaxID=1819745 RepID=A0A177BA34_9BILA|nr:hypothetical protein A3Q56_01204 [Intoshia linei]